MQGLRSIAAIVAGFGFMASTVMVGTIIATALFMPGGLEAAATGAVPAAPPAMYLVASLVFSFLGAVLGGWLAARIGSAAPFAHACALAALTAVLSVISAVQAPAAAQPGWYAIVVGIIGVAGVLLGGRLRALAAAADGAVVA
jgi:hypothetical protein